MARRLGVAPSRYLGEEPVRLARKDSEGNLIITSAPEWTNLDRNLMRALREVELSECNRCGGDLSVELTDKPPYEDDGDGHYHRFTTLWCRRCVARIKRDRLTAKDNEAAEGGALDEFTAAQIVLTERKPNPTDL